MSPRAPHEPRIARVAAMMADAARSRMLAYLLDGAWASAGELAKAASVSAPTASGHLGKLVDAGLVACEPRGRHRYFRLADAEVAQALSALALVAERGSHQRAWASPQRQRLAHARCCYGHLAGQLGVALFEQLRAGGRTRLDDDGELVLTESGRHWLAEIGVEVPAPQRGRRQAYGCLDWSERRDHLAGALGRSLLEHFIAQGWLRRAGTAAGSRDGHRALTLTPTGRQRLLPWLGLSADAASAKAT